MTRRGRDLAALGWSYLCLVGVLFSRGDMHGAEETIHSLEEIAGRSYVPPWTTNQLAAWQARIWLAQGNLDAASEWAEACELELAGDPSYLRGLEHVVLARILISQGRLEVADGKLQCLREAAGARGRTSRDCHQALLSLNTVKAHTRNIYGKLGAHGRIGPDRRL